MSAICTVIQESCFVSQPLKPPSSAPADARAKRSYAHHGRTLVPSKCDQLMPAISLPAKGAPQKQRLDELVHLQGAKTKELHQHRNRRADASFDTGDVMRGLPSRALRRSKSAVTMLQPHPPAESSKRQTAPVRSDSYQWSVQIDHSNGGRLGFILDTSSLQILSTAWQGLLGDWNVDNPQHTVKPGDRIVQVNGRSAAHEIIAECHKSHMLCFVMERAAETPQSRPTHRQWNIELTRQDEEPLGFILDNRSSKVLAIAWHGLLGHWNIHNKSHQVKPGDRIVQVNGQSDIEDIIDECRNSRSLRCLVEREIYTVPPPVAVQHWTIEIERSSDQCLGINLDMQSLQILSIAWQGALGAWNVDNPMHSVKPGDRIMRVNGSVAVDEIIARCRAVTSLSIDIARDP